MNSKSFDLVWSPESLRQIKKIKKNKSKEETEKYFERIKELIENIQTSPFSGIGKPEPLKYDYPSCWSRRITRKDRIIYRVERKSIIIISILGHYT